MDNTRKRKLAFTAAYVLLAVLTVFAVKRYGGFEDAPKDITYSELVTLVNEDKIARAEIGPAKIVAALKDDERKHVAAVRLPDLDDEALLAALRAHDVELTGKIEASPWWESLLVGWLLPVLLLFTIYWYAIRRMGRAGGPLSFAKSKAKIRELQDLRDMQRITFNDVAGVDDAEAELKEVVDFLKSPQKYKDIGARIPKGVLLVGPPGTGKTLLARAVAGEAAVPFFSLSGSEFVEMFVGVGAARMRDLFEQAKARAPCIVFIDELDAIGKSRGGVQAIATHDEREQTLNQLLVEMDGFDPTAGVVIMGATNRPEVLDRALLRAGRFDRHIVVDRPDLIGREEILKVHARGVKLENDVSLQVVARRTPGMVGADLQNVVNEAALAAARRGAKAVGHVDFEEAIDRIQLGGKKRGRAMSEDERRRVAFHECGHALVALSVEHADPVHRVTIIPRSIGALGATLQLPTQDRYLVTRRELEDRICVMLGGRAAEELTSDDISTGAENDLERATETARQMVCRFGMSERLGAVTFGRPVGARFLETPVLLGEERNFSERTARVIDDEVHRIVQEQHERAREIVSRRREELHDIAERLLVKETLEREELDALLRAKSDGEQESEQESEQEEHTAPDVQAPH